MSRYRASLIHLLISAFLVSNVIGIVFWAWYPAPAFEAVGAFSLIRLLIGVDLVIGPLLTLIVYKHGKPGLKFDLTVIALVQISALVYGTSRLYAERPEYLVFAIDRLEFVSGKRIDRSELRYDQLRTKPFAELVHVFARPPEDPAEFQRYLNSVAFDGQPDLEARPEYWEPWTAGADIIRGTIKSLDDIRTTSARDEENIRKAINEYSAAHPDLGVIPIGGIEEDIGLILDRETLEILGILYVDPWQAKET